MNELTEVTFMEMLKGVLCDGAGTIYHDGFADISRYAERYGTDPQKLSQGKGLFWVNGFSLGLMDYSQFWRKVFSYAGRELTDGEIEEINSEVLESHTPHQKMLDYFRGLKDSGRAHSVLITNTSKEWLGFFEIKYGLSGIFDSIVASCDYRTRKPGACLWEISARMTGLEKEKIAAIDDQEANLEGARIIGIPDSNLITFRSEEQAIKELNAFMGDI